MPNGDDKNWVRVCAAIDGFRARFNRWPRRVRIMPISYVDLVSHVLTPQGYALVSSVVELVPEVDAEMIADDKSGNEFCYGKEGFPEQEAVPPTRTWFGEAILRQGLGCGLEYVSIHDADGNLIWAGKDVKETVNQKKKGTAKRQRKGGDRDSDSS